MDYRCFRKTHFQHLEVLCIRRMILQCHSIRWFALHFFTLWSFDFNHFIRVSIDNRLINSISSHLMNNRCFRKSHFQHLEVLGVKRMILQCHTLHRSSLRPNLSNRCLTDNRRNRFGDGNGTHNRSRRSGSR